MHILFVNYHHIDSNSGIHIFNLANQLSGMGVECTVCVPNQKERIQNLGNYRFNIYEFDEFTRIMRPGFVDLIHAWTPRERVRLVTGMFTQGCQAPYIVHLEDNEEALLSANLGLSVQKLIHMPEKELNNLIPADLSHPIQYKNFVENAIGVTMVVEELGDFIPQTKDRIVIWPGFEENLQWSRSPDESLRRRLNITPEQNVVVYTGNVHTANRKEVFGLYLAVGLLNRGGVPTRLVRTGTDNVPLYDDSLKTLEQFCISLGHVPRSQLPNILSIADVLVQPGKVDAFNMYRFPSKLPEYLASGKPVLLPEANIGRFLKNDIEAILLQNGNALEIAQKLESLFFDRVRRRKIGEGGRRFADGRLRWVYSAEKLFEFYKRMLNT